MVAALIGLRVVVVAALLLASDAAPIDDPIVRRTEIVATSPATPYRDFPVAAMPLETVMMRVIGGDGVGATSARLAVLAFVADLAIAAAMWWGFGRRPAVVYLVLGLPLLGFIYQRFDLVSVALAVAGVAALRRRGDGASGGVSLGLAALAKLWPIALIPTIVFVRGRRALAGLVATVALGGGAWYVTAGPRAPEQVLGARGAVGWSVHGTVGSVLALAGAQPVTAGTSVRVGFASTAQLAVLFLSMVALVATIWIRAARTRDEPSGGAALTAVAALLVFAPLLAPHYTSWLLPWAAMAYEGDQTERRCATLATLALVSTGLIGLAPSTEAPNLVMQALIVARNAVLIAIVAVWLRGSRAGRSESADAMAAAG